VAWSIPSLIAPQDSVGKVGGIMNFCNQVAAIAAPVITGYLVGTKNDFSRAFVVAAAALVVGIAGYVFLLGAIERIPEP
jgi:MFS family permease